MMISLLSEGFCKKLDEKNLLQLRFGKKSSLRNKFTSLSQRLENARMHGRSSRVSLGTVLRSNEPNTHHKARTVDVLHSP